LADDLTRRQALRAGGAGAAGLALLGGAGCDKDEASAGDLHEAKLGVGAAGAQKQVVLGNDSQRAHHQNRSGIKKK
jgi:DMSO/TMAO reductase YedYZ molybdopterin-dependent catalytic subunit